jgi:hypothetical protein
MASPEASLPPEAARESEMVRMATFIDCSRLKPRLGWCR